MHFYVGGKEFTQPDAADAYSRQLPAPAMGVVPPRFRVGISKPSQRKFFGDAAAEAAYEAYRASQSVVPVAEVPVPQEPVPAWDSYTTEPVSSVRSWS